MPKCPLRVCRAEFEFVTQEVWPAENWSAEQPRPRVASIPMHNLVMDSAPTMMCPASLMVLPLDAYKEATLREQAENVERLVQRINGPVTGAGTRDREAQPHGRTPRPEKAPYWFRDHGTGPTPKGSPQGPTGYPRMQLGELGEALTSVSEVRQTLIAAEAMMEDAKAQAMTANARVTEAVALINFCRETSMDDMGAYQALAAGEALDEAIAAMLNSMEASQQYRAAL